ncbi:MAG: hypothetical protein LBL73_09455 [Synergistaceae bacterium]|jgi:hypothetical protein|nr:hypothetical protein [Synergistaceae bacterium]
MAHVGGLGGNAINPNAGGIRPPISEGQAVRPSSEGAPRIPDGTTIEGLVLGKDGEMYQVRIGANLMNARSSIPLFIGQRFRAVWDATTTPPLLRLQGTDMALLSRFAGRDQQIASALISRGLPVNDEVIWTLRQQWMQNGGNPSKMGSLVELWARGAAMTETNVALLAWYMELTPDGAMSIWKKIQDRLRSRKFDSPKELLAALEEDGDSEIRDFLKAHALAGKPARRGLDPSMSLAPAWWPVGSDESGPVMAKVSFSSGQTGGRQIWWVSFDMDGNFLGPLQGDVMTNSKSLSINLKLENASRIPAVTDNLQALRDELVELPLALQHLGVGALSRGERSAESRRELDVEA